MIGSLVGRENVYTCQKCHTMRVTVDRDAGVTPFMIGCDLCGGDMYSSFYPEGPRPSHVPAPTHEWYRPVGEELEKIKSTDRSGWHHVEQGGLLLRPIVRGDST